MSNWSGNASIRLHAISWLCWFAWGYAQELIAERGQQSSVVKVVFFSTELQNEVWRLHCGGEGQLE